MTELFEMEANEDIVKRACDMSGKDLIQLILFFDSVGSSDKKKLNSQMREFAPEWDGHTPDQAIDRIGKLMRHEPETERTCKYIWDADRHVWFCSECGGLEPCSDSVNYCCDCGAKVIGNVE